MIINFILPALLIVMVVVFILVVKIVKMNRVVKSMQSKLSDVDKLLSVHKSRIASLLAIVGGQAGLNDVMIHLVSCLEDEDKLICQAAAEVLVHFGHASIDPLISAVKTRSLSPSTALEVLKRLDTLIDVQQFLGLPDDLQCQLMSVLKKKSLKNDDLLQLSKSSSSEVLAFVLSHEKVCEIVLHTIAQKSYLPPVLQEKIAYHHLADESSLRQLIPHAEDRLLEKLGKDPNVAHNVQKSAKDELAARERKREEETRQRETEQEMKRDRWESRDDDYDYECWGIR